MKNDGRGNVAERVMYVPSYALSKKDPSRLTVMSLETAKRGIQMMRKGLGDKIVFSTAYKWWETEAKLKKDLAEENGLVGDDLVAIIPFVTQSYDEATKLFDIVANPDAEIIVVGQKYHIKRAAKALTFLFKNVRVVKVPTGMERQLDPSWLKSVLCSSTMLNFILWNWFFGLITPWMMRRQMRKQKGG